MQHLMHLILYLLLVMIEVMLFFILYMPCLFQKGGMCSCAQLNTLRALPALTVVVASSWKGLCLSASGVVCLSVLGGDQQTRGWLVSKVSCWSMQPHRAKALAVLAEE